MDHIDLFRSRTFHGLVMGVLVLMAVYEPVRGAVPAVDYVIAVGVIVAWLLGTRYERELLIGAGALERDDAVRAERQLSPL